MVFCAVAQTQVPGDIGGIDGVKPGFLFCQGALHGCRQVLFQTGHVPLAVQQKCAAGPQGFYQVVAVHIGRGVAGDKVGRADQIGRADGGAAKPQVALRETTGFFGIVDKISLAVEIGGMSDDFDGVFVGAL